MTDDIQSSSRHDCLDAFQDLAKFLVQLRRKGDIDDRVFNGLIRQIAAKFVEVEIYSRIDAALENKILDRINKGGSHG